MSSPTVLVLTLPGLSNSGPEHWQSHWERSDRRCRRVVQDEWETPELDDWISRLRSSMKALTEPVILAAHSAGCVLAARWAHDASAAERAAVIGALLVAPADPEASSFPSSASGFAPMPVHRLPFRSIVVASRNDPFVSFNRAAAFAAAWGSRLVDAGWNGHINTASGHGPWPEGYALLDELRHTAAR